RMSTSLPPFAVPRATDPNSIGFVAAYLARRARNSSRRASMSSRKASDSGVGAVLVIASGYRLHLLTEDPCALPPVPPSPESPPGSHRSLDSRRCTTRGANSPSASLYFDHLSPLSADIEAEKTRRPRAFTVVFARVPWATAMSSH